MQKFMRTRREMADFLEKTMSHAYEALEEKQKLEADTSLLKTYMLEAHAPGHRNEDVLSVVASAFSHDILGQNAKGEVTKSDEEFFYNVEVRWASNSAEFYVDATDSRFWVLHTLSKARSVDQIYKRLLMSDSRLDSAWLPIQILDNVSHMGKFRGLGLDFDRSKISDVNFDEPDAPVESLKMQLWGNRARDVLKLLSDNKDGFPEATTLSKVRVKYHLNKAENEGAFSLDDVKWDGKITARGTSFDSHISLVTSVYKEYSDKVRKLEDVFSLRYGREHEGHFLPSMSGSPLNVTFSKPLPNLEKFLSSVFSGAEPFRLWGVPVQLAETFYRVNAVDMHVSHRIIFEISPEYMRVYLPDGSCGNTIARLYCNLQHGYDSRVSLKSGEGEPFF